MRNTVFQRIGLGGVLALTGIAGGILGVVSCGTAPTPFIIQGPGTVGNQPPTLTFIEPIADLTRGQGDPFLIRWNDTDPDDNARIAFTLESATGNEVIPIVGGIDEDEATGPSEFRVATTFIPPGSYNLVASISDSVNAPIVSVAQVAEATGARPVVVTIVGPGEGPQTVPPMVAVTAPTFNRSVAQDDDLVITIRPTEDAPVTGGTVPYDTDSEARVFIVLDTDLNPDNDDLADPVGTGLIILAQQTITPGEVDQRTFTISVDVATISQRPGGEPYFIRATVDDATNPPVHSYAEGTISVVTLAAGGERGLVDLFDIGRTKSGARMQGFNPAAQLGSSMEGITDFDADGVDDFVVVAQFGNPQNAGPVGEAYLLYGLDQARFGGTISVNRVADSISGVIFQAPPVRTQQISGIDARTDGLNDVNIIADLTGDGRPELIFGLPHTHGAYDSTDYDPADDEEPPIAGCYPDLLVNNLNNQRPARDIGFYAGGMAVVVNSQNRDNQGDINPTRLESTTVALELTGQFQDIALDTAGQSVAGNILVRAENENADVIGIDQAESGRIAGSRFIAGGYDALDVFGLGQPPRDGRFGQSVASIGDLNSDGLDELIISAPRNERYLTDLLAEYGRLSTHAVSTLYTGSILVLPGANYNNPFWRDTGSEDGTSRIPILTNDLGDCDETDPEGRSQRFPAESFEIFAEDVDDWLGGAGSAGDFNQDGIDDILCGAPRNDRNLANPDTGAVYIIYGRTVFGGVELADADNPLLRPPMLRIQGVKFDDQIGWKQVAGLDVNGDRIDDVLISSPRTDFGDVKRATCEGSALPLTITEFDRCVASDGDEVFHGPTDNCKEFDYDSDGDIDGDDRCVFCCLSDDCVPEETCVLGRGLDCCDSLVDNGFVGVVFGGVMVDGDRALSQLATSELAGVRFYGAAAGDQAGFDVSSAGDFNQDGFGDILIAAPGVSVTDDAGRERLGVVYLVFGGTHLTKTRLGKTTGEWDLAEVGTEDLPGIVFMSPYAIGRPNEAPPTSVAFLGDINSDGFGDIGIGVPKADFIDPSFPQGPNAPGSDAATGRRSNVGDAYIIYGNNFGSNRINP